MIVSLTYFRSEFPVFLLFYALGMTDPEIIRLVHKTATEFPLDTIRRLLHPTLQHSVIVTSQQEALSVLMRSTQQHSAKSTESMSATYDLLCANVLPHLTTAENKCKYMAYLLGLIIKYVCGGETTHSVQYDKDHMRLYPPPGFRRVRIQPSGEQTDRHLRRPARTTDPQRTVPSAESREREDSSEPHRMRGFVPGASHPARGDAPTPGAQRGKGDDVPV